MGLEPNENKDHYITKFESMLKTDDVYFFDAEDFEGIIHYYLNIGKVALGKKAIKIGLQQHPNAIELKLLQVEVLVFEDQFEAAERLLNKLETLDPNNEEIFIQRANILSKKDDHQGAVNMLYQALQVADDCLDIYSLLGMEYLFMDDFEKAKLNFTKCLLHDETDYSALYNVIYCYEFLEDFDGAIVFLNDYLERNPYCEVAWHQLGKMYLNKELLKEALTAFDFAIISEDTFLGAYFEKGRVLEKLGNYNEAIESYQTTLTLDDPTSHAYLRIGKCHEKLGNDDLAKYYYYHTVHEDPLLDKGWLAITEFYTKKKKYQKAKKYINKAINIDSENALYWKKSAIIYLALNDLNEADFAFKQAVELGNYELDTWLEWAWVLQALKDLDSAEKVLQQGMEFYPESPEIHYHLSGLYLKTQRPSLAKENLLTALQLNPQKAVFFKEKFPEFTHVKWISEMVSKNRKASN
ncbi:Hypothetical protein I595_3495 [Croceitalea dokdonensis DOKDO 023]|uniref:Uncharacterized protein n=1 Tax=Croceitalea dokdonensis DOKDO 023 TaxID=1300341 RepID=A0A0P7ARP5_9FLAO|nr:tetratricopeptide repeat protein [Croceitalea dokdonensis]KPM30474.1 Hypothetical protein I595_3495 [Croceitalea dokdonensis DOKDO 023]